MEIKLTEAKAIKAYNSADASGKNLLENLIGKEVFNRKITDRIKTIEDIFLLAGVERKEYISDLDDENDIAYKTVKLLVLVLNEGWHPDWSDSSQRKYYEVMKNTGSGLAFGACGRVGVFSGVGSRRVLKSPELVEWAVKTFPELYKTLHS